jgi:hypothetical protein
MEGHSCDINLLKDSDMCIETKAAIETEIGDNSKPEIDDSRKPEMGAECMRSKGVFWTVQQFSVTTRNP